MIFLLLLQDLEFGLLGREVGLRDADRRSLRLKRLLIDGTLLLGHPPFRHQRLVAPPRHVGELGIGLRLLQGCLRWLVRWKNWQRCLPRQFNC